MCTRKKLLSIGLALLSVSFVYASISNTIFLDNQTSNSDLVLNVMDSGTTTVTAKNGQRAWVRYPTSTDELTNPRATVTVRTKFDPATSLCTVEVSRYAQNVKDGSCKITRVGATKRYITIAN